MPSSAHAHLPTGADLTLLRRVRMNRLAMHAGPGGLLVSQPGWLAPGRVVPRGWRLAPALAAGLLWGLAWLVLLPLPGLLREAVLYRQASGEGIGFVVPVLVLGWSFLLLAGAHLLSRRAHGVGLPLLGLALRRSDEHADQRPPILVAPRLVVAARVVTWAGFIGVLVAAGAVAAIDLGPGECFRTCAPFPR